MSKASIIPVEKFQALVDRFHAKEISAQDVIFQAQDSLDQTMLNADKTIFGSFPSSSASASTTSDIAVLQSKKGFKKYKNKVSQGFFD